MDSFLSSLFFFVVTLGILITFHEFGHFWVARKLGVKVLRFSVGFGMPLWSIRRGPDNTEYVIAALPLGGYVKMLDEREGDVSSEELGRAFNRQPLASRAAIVAAGPVFNFLLAILIYWLVFMLGVSGLKPIVGEVTPGTVAAAGGFSSGDEILAVADRETPAWRNVILAVLDQALAEETVRVDVKDAHQQLVERVLDLSGISAELDQGDVLEILGIEPARLKIPAVIGRLEAGSPALEAGLQSGDFVIKAAGKPVEDWATWVELIRSKPEEAIHIEVERDGKVVPLVLRPERVQGKNGAYGRIGAAVQPQVDLVEQFTVVQRYGPIAALGKALEKTWDVSILTLRMLYHMIFGDVSITNLSGPISIAQYAGGSASIGLVPFLTFLAIVSISLGVLNLLPIPVLDGGHLMFYFAEFVKGSPVSPQTEALGQRVGVMVILSLMVFAFYNDLVRIFG